MLPKTREELEGIADECRRMVTKAACLSAAGGAVPASGVDLAADITILIKLIPKISRRFGLSPDQISQYSERTKTMIQQLITRTGATLIGRVVTRDAILYILNKFGIRIASKQVLKYIPILGQAWSASLSFAAMKLVGNSYVKECFGVCNGVLSDGTLILEEPAELKQQSRLERKLYWQGQRI